LERELRPTRAPHFHWTISTGAMRPRSDAPSHRAQGEAAAVLPATRADEDRIGFPGVCGQSRMLQALHAASAQGEPSCPMRIFFITLGNCSEAVPPAPLPLRTGHFRIKQARLLLFVLHALGGTTALLQDAAEGLFACAYAKSSRFSPNNVKQVFPAERNLSA